MPANLENSAVATGLENVSFHSNTKKGQCQRMFKVLVSQSCLTLWDPMDCSLPSSSVHGIPQARILEWIAIPFSKECLNYCTIALISHASKVMLKILQAWLQQYVNRELPNVQAGFRKGRGTRDQIANKRWSTEKAKEFLRNTYLCFTDYAKALDTVDHNKLWKILQEMGISDHLICPLRNLYARSRSNS